MNRDVAWLYMRPLITPLIVLGFASTLAEYYLDLSERYLNLLPIIVQFYFMWLFSLVWYRATLLGPLKEHAVCPFRLKQNELKFILSAFLLWFFVTFFVLGGSFAFMCVFFFMTNGSINADLAWIKVIVAGAAVFSLISLFCLIKLLPNFFRLPAKAINLDLSYKDAVVLSRGAICLMIASWFITYGVLPPLFSYSFDSIQHVIGLIVQEGDLSYELASFFFAAIPFLFCVFYMLALNAGILARLYQSAVQGRG